MPSPVSPVNPPVILSPLNPAFKANSPSKASDLRAPTTPATRPLPPKRAPSFPSSRPLRPFTKIPVTKPPMKIITPPASFCGPQFFVLDMTQGELARQC